MALLAIDIDVRPATLEDLADLILVDRVSFDDPWTAEEWEAVLAESRTKLIRRVRVLVAVRAGKVIGYVAFRMEKLHSGEWAVEILGLGVWPEARRRLVATRLMLGVRERSLGLTLYTLVCEANLGGQLWLKAIGFACVCTVESPFAVGDQAGYLFRQESKTYPPLAVRRVPR